MPSKGSRVYRAKRRSINIDAPRPHQCPRRDDHSTDVGVTDAAIAPHQWHRRAAREGAEDEQAARPGAGRTCRRGGAAASDWGMEVHVDKAFAGDVETHAAKPRGRVRSLFPLRGGPMPYLPPRRGALSAAAFGLPLACRSRAAAQRRRNMMDGDGFHRTDSDDSRNGGRGPGWRPERRSRASTCRTERWGGGRSSAADCIQLTAARLWQAR
jgi:hypothetical protein